ncbi:hypothetical protein BDV25DRAFT_144916 [Aspergillus avenaceus]|uniref:Uncharacterized protein n=1 Tax=Aspergillus avenaceus TaxID=36643 RepID=A0A5N6TFK9_ASPAV|nr:hypothetical protein BDV25DRAFT_144916 [Aspergillus avenaceus]
MILLIGLFVSLAMIGYRFQVPGIRLLADGRESIVTRVESAILIAYTSRTAIDFGESYYYSTYYQSVWELADELVTETGLSVIYDGDKSLMPASDYYLMCGWPILWDPNWTFCGETNCEPFDLSDIVFLIASGSWLRARRRFGLFNNPVNESSDDGSDDASTNTDTDTDASFETAAEYLFWIHPGVEEAIDFQERRRLYGIPLDCVIPAFDPRYLPDRKWALVLRTPETSQALVHQLVCVLNAALLGPEKQPEPIPEWPQQDYPIQNQTPELGSGLTVVPEDAEEVSGRAKALLEPIPEESEESDSDQVRNSRSDDDLTPVLEDAQRQLSVIVEEPQQEDSSQQVQHPVAESEVPNPEPALSFQQLQEDTLNDTQEQVAEDEQAMELEASEGMPGVVEESQSEDDSEQVQYRVAEVELMPEPEVPNPEPPLSFQQFQEDSLDDVHEQVSQSELTMQPEASEGLFSTVEEPQQEDSSQQAQRPEAETELMPGPEVYNLEPSLGFQQLQESTLNDTQEQVSDDELTMEPEAPEGLFSTVEEPQQEDDSEEMESSSTEGERTPRPGVPGQGRASPSLEGLLVSTLTEPQQHSLEQVQQEPVSGIELIPEPEEGMFGLMGGSQKGDSAEKIQETPPESETQLGFEESVSTLGEPAQHSFEQLQGPSSDDVLMPEPERSGQEKISETMEEAALLPERPRHEDGPERVQEPLSEGEPTLGPQFPSQEKMSVSMGKRPVRASEELQWEDSAEPIQESMLEGEATSAPEDSHEKIPDGTKKPLEPVSEKSPQGSPEKVRKPAPRAKSTSKPESTKPGSESQAVENPAPEEQRRRKPRLSQAKRRRNAERKQREEKQRQDEGSQGDINTPESSASAAP